MRFTKLVDTRHLAGKSCGSWDMLDNSDSFETDQLVDSEIGNNSETDQLTDSEPGNSSECHNSV